MMLLSGTALHAQKYPERKFIRSGNKQYAKGNFSQSEVEYKRALEKTPDTYEANFNLGNAQYKQERYDEAVKIFKRLAADSTCMDQMAACHYNAGNAYFQQRKLREALEEYKSALRLNPSDEDAKFNLAYVKKLLENEQNGGGGDQNQQNKDKDKQDKDKDKQDKQDKDKQDQNDDQKEDKQDKDDKRNDQGKNDQKPQDGQSQQQGISREEAEQMLQAIQAQEDKTQEKVDEKKKGIAAGSSRRNW